MSPKALPIVYWGLRVISWVSFVSHWCQDKTPSNYTTGVFSRQNSRMSGEGGQLAVHRVAVNSARYYRHRNIAATAKINRCCQMCLHPLFGGTQA